MKCDRCHEKTAVVKITQTINGNTEDLHLCKDCSAKMQAEYAKHSWAKLFHDNFFGGWLGGTGGIPSFGDLDEEAAALKCPDCNTTYNDFRRTGLFGCPTCYRAFQERLDKMFLRVQGGIRHTGRVPDGHSAEVAANEQIQDLQKKQKEAIAAEDYERAAAFRDELRRLTAACEEEGR